jgi:hypothetical protein
VELNSYRAAGHVYSESEARDICCIMEGIHTNLLQLPEFNGSVHIETLKVKLKAALDDFYAAYGLMQVRYNLLNFTVTYCSQQETHF